MEKIDFKTILEELLDESKNWALMKIKENEAEIEELKRELGIDEIDFGSDNAVKFQKLVLDKIESAEDFDQYKKYNVLFTALWTTATSLNIEIDKIINHEEAVRMYCLGRTHGSLESVVPDLMPVSLYEKYFHSLKMKSLIQERWNKRDEELTEALGIADKKWENGDPALHTEMAKFLEPKFPNLSYDVLKKRLRPIAKKYNRLFGVKGVKKEI
jgi:hypothetical protein